MAVGLLVGRIPRHRTVTWQAALRSHLSDMESRTADGGLLVRSSASGAIPFRHGLLHGGLLLAVSDRRPGCTSTRSPSLVPLVPTRPHGPNSCNRSCAYLVVATRHGFLFRAGELKLPNYRLKPTDPRVTPLAEVRKRRATRPAA